MTRDAGEDVVDAPEAIQEASQVFEGTEECVALVCEGSSQEEEKEESGGIESGVEAAINVLHPLTGHDGELATEREMR
ncbi:hypothetical protein GN244_ATG18702 [Phytophthora infestans]|uniref:Uncharacterized protein n=1 Tax=Phytophthora infestans TaxID=4787 RepID=A0A833RPB4_PHYIN|nr:hypothetical protein GN244_ATG18702 [Phytophthora infestans]KAF4138962.1 hypothetical protein GN958_ATG11919 [Phytophthora infestans]